METARSSPNSNNRTTADTVRIGDLVVSRLGFGAMRITGRGVWGPPANRAESMRVLRRAVDLGVTLIDTADSYGPGVSEELIAEALAPYGHGLVIATKGGLTRPGPGEWRRDGRPEHLRAACEASLKRLRVDHIELYQLHSPDPRVPLEDSVGALVELQREGKIDLIGVSNFSVSQLRVAQSVAPIASVQNHFNRGYVVSEDVLAACEADGIAFMPWAPLGEGLTRGSAYEVRWLLDRSPVILPIPGTSSVAHLEETMRAVE